MRISSKQRDHGPTMTMTMMMMMMMLERMIKDDHPVAVRCRDSSRLLIAGHWVFKWNPVTCADNIHSSILLILH